MQQNATSLTSILPVLLAIAGMVSLNLDTLRSSRPATPTKTLLSGLEEPQAISALLWQDPLTAVETTTEKGVFRDLKPVPQPKPPTFTNRPEGRKPSRVLIVPVFVNSGTFAEQVEGRSRARKALVEALGSCNFSPKNRDHLGCYTVDWATFVGNNLPAGGGTSTGATQSAAVPACPCPQPLCCTCPKPKSKDDPSSETRRELRIPFEWFTRGTYSNARLREFFGPFDTEAGQASDAKSKAPESAKPSENWSDVLVLWLRTDAFNTDPLTRVNNLLARIHQTEIETLQVVQEAPAKPAYPPEPAQFDVRILGPANSTGLVKMVQELTALKAADTSPEVRTQPRPRPRWAAESLPMLRGARIISPIATLPTAHIAYHATAAEPGPTLPEGLHVGKLYELFNEAFHDNDYPADKDAPSQPGHLIRTVATDDQICRTLLEELRRRGVQVTRERTWRSGFKPGPDHIAIIAEWDTEYGRSLPYVFATEATKEDGVVDLNQPPQDALVRREQAELRRRQNEVFDRGNWPHWIHTFTYLQGLDGRTTDAAKPKPTTTTTDLTAYTESLKNTTPGEGVAGQNHADYLRRLAASLAARDRELRRTTGRGIRAVGVLGSDVYDKLMILRALRAELPDMLYFTNNLDAQLFHKDELPATRNLIVASPYGLQLHPGFQGAVSTGWGDAVNVIAPFRDTYQTATYTGMLTLMGKIPETLFPRMRQDSTKGNVGQPHYPENPLPRIFEIGRYGPLDISLREPVVGPRTHQLHPERADLRPLNFWPWKSLLTFWGWAGVAIALLTLHWTHATGDHTQPARFRRANKHLEHAPLVSSQVHSGFKWLLIGVLLTEVFFFIIRITLTDWSEPFSRTSGTSLWPTEALRLIAIMLAMHFIYQIQKIMLRNYYHISDTFFDRKQRMNLTRMLARHKLPFWRHPWRRLKAGFHLTFLALKHRRRRRRALAQAARERYRTEHPHPLPALQPPSTISATDADALAAAMADAEADAAFADLDPGQRQNPAILWKEHLEEMRPSRRGVRWFISAVLYTLAVMLLLKTFDEPPARYRGGPSQFFDTLFSWLSIAFLAYVSFAVADILRQGAYLIQRLNHGTTDWHQDVALRKQCPHDDSSFGGVAEWLDMKFMVARTAPVGRLTMYPIWLFAVLLFARLPCFDKFSWSFLNLMALGGCVIYVCYRAIRLRASAFQARTDSLSRLNRLQVASSKLGPQIKEALEKIAEDFKNETGGAFASLTQQPFVRLIMWLGSAFGLGSLAAYLSVVLG